MPPLLTYFAINWDLGFAIPMLVGTMFGLVNFILSLVFGPETKGTVDGRRTVGGLSWALR